MEVIESIKAFFEQYKIFFEIFGWIGLGIASILLTFRGVQVSRRQLEVFSRQTEHLGEQARLSQLEVILAEKQLQVAQSQSDLLTKQTTLAAGHLDIENAAHLPKFSIYEHYMYNEETKFAEETVLEIWNNGYTISEYSSHVIIIYTVTRMPMIPRGKKLSLIVPLNGYYFLSYRTKNQQGKLEERRGRNNNRHYVTVDHDIVDANKKHGVFYKQERIVLVEIKYRDFLGRKGVEYFFVDGSGGKRINEAEAKEIYNTYETEQPLGVVEISEFSSRPIIEYFETHPIMLNEKN